MSCRQKSAPSPRDAAKMSPRISIGPEPVLAAHAPSPPAAGSHCPAREDFSSPLRNRICAEQNFGGWGAVKICLKSLKFFILIGLKSCADGGWRRGCGGIGRAAQRGADPVHPVRRCKVPLVRPPRAPGSAPPTRAAPEPISLPNARRTPPQRHARMARAHGACGTRTLRHGWVLDFNDLIARVRDKVAAAECRWAGLKCEIAQIGLCARAPAAPVRSARVGR
jgi:hypothetical protein